MNRVDTDTATMVSLWVGIASFFLGFAAIALTLYSFYRAQPDTVVLTASGWVAALLTAVVCGWVGKRLVRLAAALCDRVAALSMEVAELKAEKDRIMVIGEYLASQSTKTARRKQTQAQTDQPTQE